MERTNKSTNFVISTADSRYIKPLLQALIEENSSKGWRETLSKEKFDMKWVGSSVEDEELIKLLNGDKPALVNRFPGIQGLCHKDQFNRVMKIGQTLNQSFFDFVPPQFTFPQDSEKFNSYHSENKNTVFIAKPVASSEDGYKFDLRIYVVITQINPLQAFICDEGLARFCTEKYELPTRENYKKFFMHLTNYSINKHSEDYKESPNILDANDDTKRTLASLWKTFEIQGIDRETVWENIKETCSKTLAVYAPFIEHGVAVASNLKPIKGKYFQILGFDLLIDENLKAHILEINDHPSLNIFLEKDYMGGGMGKSLSQIDLYVKKRVTGDAIKLAKKTQEKIAETEEFRSLTKIYPNGEAVGEEISNALNKVRQVYYDIAPIKSKANITSSDFQKLRIKSSLINGLVENSELNLIFQKVSQGSKFVEFHEFFYLFQPLKDLLEKKNVIGSYEVRTNRIPFSVLVAVLAIAGVSSLDNLLEQRDSQLPEKFTLLSEISEDDNINYNETQLDELRQLSRKSGGFFYECDDDEFLNSKKKCQSCPTGCQKCSDTDMCTKCEDDYTLISGVDFGYCFPSCTDGYFIKTKYTNKDSFKSSGKRTLSKKDHHEDEDDDESDDDEDDDDCDDPKLVVSECQTCPFGCSTCVYDKIQLKPFCNTCLRGFTFNVTTGFCDITPCKTGEYRPKPLNSSVTLNPNSSSYNDYMCKPCSNGCVNCSNATSCNTCNNSFAKFQLPKNYSSSCVQCTSFCTNCSVTNSSKSNETKCSACQTKFDLYPNNTCILNRTCPSGYWFNDTRLECQKCPDNCLTCKQGEKNGTVLCTSCIYTAVLNSTTQLCNDRCNYSTNFFSNKTSACQECPAATYPNQTAQACVNCPTYCTNCTANQTSQSVQCTNCSNTSYMDSAKRRCRTNCNSTAFFNYDNATCVNCKKGQYLNPSNETCLTCPQNCTSCFFNNNTFQVECDSCNSSLVLDQPTKRCRQNCSANQIYNWSTGKCANCSAGTLYNSTTQVCDSCPYGCTNCTYNTTSKNVECTKCDNFKTLNSTYKLCQDTCYYGKQWYWETYTCRNCPLYQYFVNNKCQDCPFGCPDCYQLGSNTYCTYCNSSTIYDYNEWKCKLDCQNQTTFNWNTNTCQKCPSGQYFDTTTNNCKACGSQCSQCVLKTNSTTQTNCTQCNSGYVLNATTTTCRAECPSYQYYDWSKSKCTNCSTGTFLNVTTQQCQACPSNCSACFYDTNLNQTNCTACKTGIFDSSQYKCRAECSSTQFFNWNTSSCENCPSGTYLNSQQQCVNCPKNCTNCYQNSSGYVICTSCTSDTTLDSIQLQCKPDCPSSQQYDFNLQKCQNCNPGQYVNSSGKCADCPGTCSSCAYFSSNKSISCYTCDEGSYLNTSRMDCRLNCDDTQTYDWATKTCKNCNSSSYLNKTSDQCKACPSQCDTCKMNASTSQSNCLTCKSGYVFDNYYQDCKLQCNSTSYFDWTTRQCIQCSPKFFLNPETQSCQQCPSGCSACQYDSSTQTAKCSSCDSGYKIDQSNSLCYQPCNSTSFYNWNTLSCQNCPTGTYSDSSNNQCVNCPTNCSSCSLSSSGQVKCDSCKSGYQIDSSTNLCRQTCNSTSYYDSTSQQCIQCSAGQYLNPTSQVCVSCPQGCTTCSVNSTGLPECTTCTTGLVIDSVAKRCQQQCASGQYFDYTTFSCVGCSSFCIKCSSTNKCTQCQTTQYTLTNGACVDKCTQSQTWNSNTQTCDNPTTSTQAYFRLTASATSMVRCNQYTVAVTFISGVTTNNFKSVVWSYTNSNKASGDFVSQLDQQISIANSLNNLTFYLVPSFTENVTAQFSIKIQAIVTAANGSTATNTTSFVIYPYRYTTLTGYQSSYTIDGTVGQNIVAQYYYPNCPIYKGPETIPSTVDIGCSLYDSSSNYIKDLSYCKVAANDATNGLTYYVKYYFLPNSYQSAVRDTITINTIVTQPTCQIASSNLITVLSTGSITLNVTVQNQLSGFVYKWNCYSLTSGATCGVVSSTQNTANLNLPASGFTANAKYAFILSILSNSVNQTTCTAYVQVDSASSVTSAFALLLTSSATATVTQSLTTTSTSGSTSTLAVTSLYLDPSTSNNVACQSTKTTTASDVSYSISVIQKSNQKTVITKKSMAMSIPSKTLSANTNYQILCTASSSTKGTENVLTEVNTNVNLNLVVSFTISPSSGTEKSTVFTFKVTKPSNTDLWCRFGYNLTSGITYINDPKLPVYNDQAQQLDSTLIVQNSKGGSHVMVARCSNSAGQFVSAYQTITLNKYTQTISKLGTTKFTALNLLADMNNLYFEQIEDQYNAYKQLNNSQISTQERINFLNTTLLQLQQVSKSLTNFQLTDAAKMIASIWNEIKQNEDLKDSSLICEFAKSSISLLKGEITNSQIHVINQDQFLTFLGIFDEMLNDQLDTLKDAGLIDSLIDSIKTGQIRHSANIAPDSDNFTASGFNFALQIQKQSKSKLLQLQHTNQMRMYPTAFQTQNLSLADSADQVIVEIPFYLMMTQYDFIIMNYLLIDKQLGYKAGEQRPLSDQIEVDSYFSSSPIAITDVYDIGIIKVSNVSQMMHITLPYKLGEKDNSAHALCSYLNEDKNIWSQLSCSESDESLSKAALSNSQICCTNHLTLFGLIYDTYYDELAKMAFRQIVFSMIPPAIIYSALLVAIANSVLKYRKIRARQLQQETKRLQKGAEQNQPSSQDDESARQAQNNNSQREDQQPNAEDRRYQYVDRSPDPSMINATVADMMYEDTLQASKAQAQQQNNQVQQQNSSSNQTEQTQQDLAQEKSKSQIKNRRCKFLQILKLSKVYVFFFVLNPDSSIFTIVFEKVILCNLFILSFTITMIIASYAKELSTIILASYVILLLFVILFRQFQGIVNNGTAVKDILFAFHLILLVAQSAFIVQLADNLSLESFNYFLISSCVTLFISCTLEDMVFIPIYNKAAKVLNNKLRMITKSYDPQF